MKVRIALLAVLAAACTRHSSAPPPPTPAPAVQPAAAQTGAPVVAVAALLDGLFQISGTRVSMSCAHFPEGRCPNPVWAVGNFPCGGVDLVAANQAWGTTDGRVETDLGDNCLVPGTGYWINFRGQSPNSWSLHGRLDKLGTQLLSSGKVVNCGTKGITAGVGIPPGGSLSFMTGACPTQ